MQLAAIVISLVTTLVGTALAARAALYIYTFVKLGADVPAGARTGNPGQRVKTVAKEFLGHTRMNKWGVVGVAHWFVATGFFCLVLTLVTAYGQLFSADFALPLIGALVAVRAFDRSGRLRDHPGIARP